jgi:hypothetical protein
MIGIPETDGAQSFMNDNGWFRDGQGRYLLFRGINFSTRSKRAPYLPILPLDKSGNISIQDVKDELNQVEVELDLLKTLGFNVVRLPIMWKAIEPIPNPDIADEMLPEGKHYLTLINEIIQALYSRQLFIIIDFHQDIAHEIFGGDGFPDWALALDEDHKRPSQSDLKDKRWSLHFYDKPYEKNTLRHTVSSFWLNNLNNIEEGLYNFPVRTHFEKTVGQTCKFFMDLNEGKGQPAILGYEPFNEPHPVMDRKTFEMDILPAFYKNVEREIRRWDEKAFMFIEPRADWYSYSISQPESDLNFTSSPETYLRTNDLNNERTVFSFHYYDPWTTYYGVQGIGDNMYNKKHQWSNIFRMMQEAAAQRGLIPFLTEFGANCDWDAFNTDLNPLLYHHKQTRAYIDLIFEQIEDKLLNAVYWTYDLYHTEEEKDNWNLENFSLLGPKRIPRNLDLVARPYPVRSSAKPKSILFSAEKKICIIKIGQPIVDLPTIIYIPTETHFANGFKVWAGKYSTFTWNSEKRFLYWDVDKNRHLNKILITEPKFNDIADSLDYPFSAEVKDFISSDEYQVTIFEKTFS